MSEARHHAAFLIAEPAHECSTCEWFQFNPFGGGHHCTRRAPTYAPGKSGFPGVTHSDRCGDWQHSRKHQQEQYEAVKSRLEAHKLALAERKAQQPTPEPLPWGVCLAIAGAVAAVVAALVWGLT